jgi:hypothetical protein
MRRVWIPIALLLAWGCGGDPPRPAASEGADCTKATPVDGHCPAGCEVVAGECAKSKGLCTPNDPACSSRTGG